jgi:hypothetical protein
MRRVWGFALAATIIVATSTAAAQPSKEDEALAEELFRAGKRLAAEGNFDEGCPKLAESYRLDPGGGTLLTLALCHESQGLTASAWADFTAAIVLAKRDGRVDRESIAQEHAAALVPKLRRLRVRVTTPTPLDFVVERDGAVLGPAAWNVAAPVDPGEHVVEAKAPGRIAFHTVVSVEKEGASVDVDIPILAAPRDVAPPITTSMPLPPPPPPEPPPRKTMTTLRWISIAAGGLGVIAGGTGIAFGLDARSKNTEANSRCPSTTCSDPRAVDLSRKAGDSADISTASFVVAGGLLGAATVLFVLSAYQKN